MSTQALIVGASGQVGQALMRQLEVEGQSWIGTCHTRTDIASSLLQIDLKNLDSAAGLVRRVKPAVVYFPSGWTWVDGCEDDPEKALRINALAPERAAKAAAQIGAAFVFFSTEYVFGEQGGPYSEKAKPKPLGVYGASKLEGERRVAAAHPAALILRTTVVYGPEPQGKNTMYQVLRRLVSGQEVQLPSDQITSPTYNEDLARAAMELVKKKERGIFNAAGSGVIARDEFARLSALTFGFDPARVKGFLTASMKQKAARPLGAGLRTEKLQQTLGWVPRGPRQGLKAAKAVGVLLSIKKMGK